MNTSSARTWLVVLPVVGGGVAGGLGFVIPGLGAVVLGVAGLGAGAAMAVLLVYLATVRREQSEPDRQRASGRTSGQSGVSNARLEVVVTDAVTGDPVPAPVEVTAEQTFVDERRQVVAEDGRCTFELRTLTWTVTASHAGLSATVEADVGDAERVEVTLPPKRVTVAVEDRGDDPLTDAEVSCTAAPVDAARVAADADSEPGVHVLEVPTATERAMLVADHDDFETERADVLLGDDPATDTTVTLERPASEREVVDSTDGVAETDDVEEADAEREAVETESPFAASQPHGGASATDDPATSSDGQTATGSDEPTATGSDGPTATPSERGGGTAEQEGSASERGGTPERGGSPSERAGSATDRNPAGTERSPGSEPPADRGSDPVAAGGSGDGAAPSDRRPEATTAANDESADAGDGSATETPAVGDESTETDDESVTGTPEAARSSIPEVGVTGIDRHTPAYSPNPARIDLNADVLAAADEDDAVSRTDRATVSRIEVADRTVAVKQSAPDGTGGDVTSEMVARADEWRDIDDHPNVATLVDAGSEPQPYLAVEFVEHTLADADVPFDQRVGLWHAVRLADAVAQAHRNRVFHLDLKPSNVLLESVESNAWPVAKLTDWDLPRLLDPPSDVFKPLDGAYAAPEQARPDEFEGVDERTDVYQLGVLTYELLTGDPPMDGRHADRDAPDDLISPVTDGRPELADELDHILQTATAVRKRDRYSSADDLRDSLRSVVKSVAGGF